MDDKKRLELQEAYKKGDVILQVGNLGLRIGYPIAWEKALEEV